VKTVLLLMLVVAIVWVVVNRQRLYVRDPVATVYRDDVKQSGVQVFINYSNDVLLWQDAEPGAYRILVQGWNRVPGTPVRLTCVRWMMCLADGDHAQTYPIEGVGKHRYDPRVSMTNREVSFVGGDGTAMRVVLR
jgi:hypothetical protein